ncbi:MAG: hypothetical protein RLZZ59_904 [Pseudomonadota bacterium]|jgi:Sec-independent protein translocase protein TatA
MSISEIGLILIIGLFVLKPQDMKAIGKFIKTTMDYLASFKKDMWKMLDEEDANNQKNSEQINMYLEKIIKISGKYDGEYDLGSVKAYYHKLLIKEKITSPKKVK